MYRQLNAAERVHPDRGWAPFARRGPAPAEVLLDAASLAFPFDKMSHRILTEERSGLLAFLNGAD